MRGRTDAANQLQIELGITFYHGYTVAKCEGYAESLGISAAEFTRRLAALLAPATEIREPLGLPDSLQILRGETGSRGQSLEPLALDDGARHGARRPRTLPQPASQENPSGQALTKGQKVSAAMKTTWGISPRERVERSLKMRLATKHKTPSDQKAIRTMRRQLAGKEPLVSAQTVYRERRKAREAGLPLPPLPGKSTEERRKRLDRERHRAYKGAGAKKTASQKSGGKSWADMNEAERSAEMKRRMNLAKKNKAKAAGSNYVDAGTESQVRQATQQAAIA